MELQEIKAQRQRKAHVLREKGMDPYGSRFLPVDKAVEILEPFEEGRSVRLAGRIIAQRSHGKVMFMDLLDSSGRIQLFFKADVLGGEAFELLDALDIGDIIGVEGTTFRTKTGQESVRVTAWRILAKGLRSLPEKWHGLRDVDLRYRQRYVDLIVNPKVRAVFKTRTRIITLIRSFLDEKGFLEVETPMLHPTPGGARGRPFRTHHHAYDLDVYLRIAPELYLKRLLVGGFEKIYELNRNFRNEGVSPRHNPEFTMLEVYEAYADFGDMMRLTEEMIGAIVKDLFGTHRIAYQGQVIDFAPPWRRTSFAALVREQFGILPDDPAAVMVQKLRRVKPHLSLSGRISRSAVMKIIEELLEQEGTADPLFITDYFTFLSPLAKARTDDPLLAQRFECFIGGLEVANAYTELNDPVEQRRRLAAELDEDDETGNRRLDEDFLAALEYGMPPAGGLGVGVDRLVMLLTDSASIKEVVFFPLMKPCLDHEPSGNERTAEAASPTGLLKNTDAGAASNDEASRVDGS